MISAHSHILDIANGEWNDEHIPKSVSYRNLDDMMMEYLYNTVG